MNRCTPSASVLLASFLGLFSNLALAQTSGEYATQPQAQAQNPYQAPRVGVRQFPASAKRGWLQVTTPPDVVINGDAERLSPGHRIRAANNSLVMSAQLVGRKFEVNYTRNPQGQIHEVWILTRLEAQEEREGGGVLKNFRFGSDEDKPKRDDGKTPFDQLPKYKP
jgi:hypothetical protein